MTNPLNRLGGPAILVGAIAAALLAAIQSLAGDGVIGEDVLATVAGALDPTKGGWLLPLLIGALTRFFVSPAERVGWK